MGPGPIGPISPGHSTPAGPSSPGLATPTPPSTSYGPGPIGPISQGQSTPSTPGQVNLPTQGTASNGYVFDQTNVPYHAAHMAIALDDISMTRESLRGSFEDAAAIFTGKAADIGSALAESWTFHVSVQCQASHAKGANALAAYRAVAANFAAGDEEMAFAAAAAADSIPQDVMSVTDPLIP